MGEWYPGSIKIGGKVPAEVFEDFLKELRDSGAGPDWEGGMPDDVTDAASLLALRNEDGHLHLLNNQAPGGFFWNLAGRLREWGIAYNAHSDSHYECNALHYKWRPGFNEEVVTPSDNDGNEFVDREKVSELRESIRCSTPVLDRGEVLKALDAVLGPEVSPLPPLVIAAPKKRRRA